ncbi:hypothetical protein C8A00DRAFT_28632 [Chaetomidium leptoderma]|uniref:NACHT domain-containing protein n=1 Tax=Chaetomidium leptoderma TaxID=669021 RepID=A0AAN6VX03_9PEZI|nr:hypothetical protein C8A00DRAFT_28632 [Chaetomidium leptoderma]
MASPNPPAQGLDAEFRRVVQSFIRNANPTPDELEFFEMTTLDDLKATLCSIEKKQSQRKTLVFLKRIEPFIDTMIEFGKIVEVFLNVTDILAFIWGPLKFLLTVTKSYADAFNSLLEIYQELSEQIPLFESFKSLFSQHGHMRKLLVMIYEDILNFHWMALKYSARVELFRANWKGFTSKVDHIKGNLRRHKDLIESHASVAQVEEIRALRLREKQRSQEDNEDRIRRRKVAVFQWLSPPAVEVTHERYNKVRSSNPESCRKSVLSSFIIDQAKQQTDISVAYFYFAYGDSQRNNFLGMARAILSQLLAQNEALLDCYNSVMAVSCAHGHLSSQQESEKLLETALKSRKTYIVLDGLDECPRDQRKDICTWFRSVVDKLERNKQDEIRCLFVSQEDGFAKKDLSWPCCPRSKSPEIIIGQTSVPLRVARRPGSRRSSAPAG